MAIKIMVKEGRTVPIICCDVCGSWIDDAGIGAVVFPNDAAEGEVREVLFAHKRTCHDRAEERLGGRSNTGWQELRTHLLYLTHNTGLTPDKLKQMADDEKQFGTL